MDRLAGEAVDRYLRMDFAELVGLARAKGYAEVRSEGDYQVSVACLLDDPGREDAVRILASVNRRASRLSFMFPRTKVGLAVRAGGGPG